MSKKTTTIELAQDVYGETCTIVTDTIDKNKITKTKQIDIDTIENTIPPVKKTFAKKKSMTTKELKDEAIERDRLVKEYIKKHNDKISRTSGMEINFTDEGLKQYNADTNAMNAKYKRKSKSYEDYYYVPAHYEDIYQATKEKLLTDAEEKYGWRPKKVVWEDSKARRDFDEAAELRSREYHLKNAFYVHWKATYKAKSDEERELADANYIINKAKNIEEGLPTEYAFNINNTKDRPK